MLRYLKENHSKQQDSVNDSFGLVTQIENKGPRFNLKTETCFFNNVNYNSLIEEKYFNKSLLKKHLHKVIQFNN